MKIMDFSSANCKNCYKCVRNCAMKAIKILNDQAQIEEDRCIACGQCFAVCPQNARNIHSDLSYIKEAIAENKEMIISIAPSYMGIYKNPKKLITALRKLGFTVIQETAIGAEILTQFYKEYISTHIPRNIITSCCPSVNLMIEKYYPELLPYLLPFDSPMMIHCKLLKEKYGFENTFVTFLGPCISKKREAFQYKGSNEIDAVLSFEELEHWLEEEKIDLLTLPESQIDYSGTLTGQCFPIENGIVTPLKPMLDQHNYKVLTVNGLDDCKNIFETLKANNIEGVFIEANTCKSSCMGGPATPETAQNIQLNKLLLMNQLKQRENVQNDHCDLLESNCLKSDSYLKDFTDKSMKKSIPSESAITNILQSIGKYTKDDELNCGACGYNSCREKACAVLEGMSHPEMCMPFMRSKAEKLTNTIFKNSPNLILLLDRHLNIIDINPAAEKAFLINQHEVLGHYVGQYINPEDFLHVKETKESIIGKKKKYFRYQLVTLENILYLESEGIYLGIFYNCTQEDNKNKELIKLKQNTLDAAENIIIKQMRVAQEIASLLGETTAETKVTLLNLQKLISGEED